MKALRPLMMLALLAVPPVPAMADPAGAEQGASLSRKAEAPDELFAIFGDFAGKVVSINDRTEHMGSQDISNPELAANDPVVTAMKEVADRHDIDLHFVIEGVENKDIPSPGAVTVTIRKVGDTWRVAPVFTRE